MRRLRRFLLGCVGSALLAGAVFGIWRYGLERFDEDYCRDRVEVPSGQTQISDPEWEPPMTYRCDYGADDVVAVNEPRPILWTGAMSGVGLLLVSAVWWKLARSEPPSPTAEYEGKHVA